MEFFSNDITDYYIFSYVGISFCVTFIATILAFYAFHAFTKRHHFREWKEVEPLDSPISKEVTWTKIQRYPELRKEAYQLLCETISYKLDENITGEHIPYATMQLVNGCFMPNGKTDRNDILFSILALQTIRVVNEIDRDKYIAYLKEKLPNYNF